MIETGRTGERAVLVGLIYPGQGEDQAAEYLDELSFLAETAGAEPVRRFLQKLQMPDPRTFVGSGKIAEIGLFVSENRIQHCCFRR